MADWRQIQARIRKARNSADPVTALTEIYQRTRDGMAAYELARALEKAERIEEAVTWYTTAAERFRRADWKRKALDALARLGASVPLPGAESQSSPSAGETSMFTDGAPAGSSEAEPEFDAAEEADDPDVISPADAAEPVAESGSNAGVAAKKRRRGRRGGRGRRRGKGKAVAQPATPPPAQATARDTQAPARAAEQIRERYTAPAREYRPGPVRAEPARTEPAIETHTVGSAIASMRGRSGDPGMASRLAHLESQLRRMLAATPHSMDDVESAPAGPGVFVISESDQTTYYYVEACRTLRIALAQIARTKGSGGVRAQLAEHLGISESKVSKYLKDHCVARWLQLDEDSSRLAHFAIAVLRPALNE